jgi:predicted O-methyltransferase YrrM
MTEHDIENIPNSYFAIVQATKDLGFTMPSDMLTCSLLRTLAATKPSGKFLELGTGTGLSTSWILDGMDKSSTLVSIDNDKSVLNIAKTHLGKDSRLSLVLSDGEDWVLTNIKKRFDYIFADTWHGKYLLLEEVLDMLNPGGLYIVDDMLPQANWPEGHAEKALIFVKKLESRTDLILTKMNWATGIIIGVKR